MLQLHYNPTGQITIKMD
uniref:Uncharacterized protein n=1 Tax=Moniliophthora roreri TaxID=221103 RepID=A0A0W0G206_MONRR